MSRIGKQPIIIPAGVDVRIADGTISVHGPKGTLVQNIHPEITVTQEDSVLHVHVTDPEQKDHRALWGLFQRLISNMVIGVTQGFEKKLEVNGIGYKVAISGKKLVLHLGFSHPVDVILPDGVEGKIEKNVIVLSSIDKQLVGEIAAHIRKLRKPEPYKGKGIKYIDEVIRRKAGKAGKAGAK
ncbi:50S ribosomal protein L6 [Candidatus Uhrbacteria bacterium]|nr:50S ribosomal protein L6 [Candidatus Uhrbacteria bacterium]